MTETLPGSHIGYVNRRDFLAAGTAAGVTGLFGPWPVRGDASELTNPRAFELDGRLPKSKVKLSVSRWPYNKFTLDQLCQMSRELGLDAIDLLEPNEWAIPRKYGLTCAVGYATVPNPETRLTQGFNHVENHAWLIPAYERAIPLAAAAGEDLALLTELRASLPELPAARRAPRPRCGRPWGRCCSSGSAPRGCRRFPSIQCRPAAPKALSAPSGGSERSERGGFISRCLPGP